jgi:hypothetical protein
MVPGELFLFSAVGVYLPEGRHPIIPLFPVGRKGMMGWQSPIREKF